MQPLSGSDLRYLEASEGWLTLGNLVEASNELENITPKYRAHPDVLELRCRIYATAGRWEYCSAIAQTLTEQMPDRVNAWIYYARALHHLKRDQTAYELLTNIASQFPESPELFYLIAVVSCSLGNTPEARKWITKSFELGGKELKLVALEDDELEPLWRSSET